MAALKPHVYVQRGGEWYPLYMDAENETQRRQFATVTCAGDAAEPLSPDELIADPGAAAGWWCPAGRETRAERAQRRGGGSLACRPRVWWRGSAWRGWAASRPAPAGVSGPR